MINLADLNSIQREAVQVPSGPVLVLAGAGSGKTRVITYRIAYLIQEGLAKPWEILAVTFTNKAASEMRQRVNAMLKQNLRETFIGTFHSYGASFLRRHAESFGRTSRFTIFDEDDQSRLIRSLLKGKIGSSDAKGIKSGIQSFIEKVKCNLIPAESVTEGSQHPLTELYLQIYEEYEKLLKQNNAFDFDDLIRLPCLLLKNDNALRSSYRQRYRYLLIDEFQDTNLPQGELARLICAPSGNITAVGDDDQSIYGWRGARLGNILQFEDDYKGVKIFRLEQNYRSTQAILNTAHQVIQKNISRHPKKLWTDRDKGEKPKVLATSDDHEEAERVVETISNFLHLKKFKPGDIAILYRTNAQSRTFEDALMRNRIPYVIVGGLRFYERKEIKDFLAYLRLLVNPDEIISLQRVINLPPRGIGAKTITHLDQYAAAKGIGLFQAILHAKDIEGIGKSTANKLSQFAQWINEVRSFAEKQSLFKVGERLLFESKLIEYYKKEDAQKSLLREENLSELLNALRQYSYSSERPCREDLNDFLQEVALVTDIDGWNREEQAVTLMTLHSAKGLEFPAVFLTGLEEGLFPIQSALDEPEEIEEERRLFYVGATRAKDLLILTYARNRMRWGKEIPWQSPSRFLKEIPDEFIEYEESGVSWYNKVDRKSSNRFEVPRTIGGKVEQEFSLGSRVQHDHFGEGIVINTEGSGYNLRLLVNFENFGDKLLLASHAKLTALSD